MEPDDPRSLRWEVAATAAGSVGGPADLGAAELEWLPAEVPGAAAGALRAAGRWSLGDERDFDAEDWWFRTTVPATKDGLDYVLRFDGIASIGEVWLDGQSCLSFDNMFSTHEVPVGPLDRDRELVLCCRALRPLLDQKHPRPRWKTRLVADQSLRWHRTTFLGRTPGFGPVPAPVGPWRPVRLVPDDLRLIEHHLECWVDGDDGLVRVEALVSGSPDVARLVIDASRERSVDLRVDGSGTSTVLAGELRVPNIERWWPHTHGSASLYAVHLEVGDHRLELGRVGFRTIDVDRANGAFALKVNGVDVFCRGACWVPLDPITFADDPSALRAALADVRDAGMNMLRLTGTMVYESQQFWDLCDELGILVWQDAMFANVDPPDDDAFLVGVEAELDAAFAGLQGRPSLAVVCGGSEIEQQATMMGRPPHEPIALLDTVIPGALQRWLPGVPYVRSSPTGGDLPFQVDEGVGHYYGVGAYLRPLEDARRANVRFTTECLAFAIPPERQTMTESFGLARATDGDEWQRAIPRDRDAGWDFQDVSDHYVSLLHGVDAAALRASDPDRALDLARATVAHLVETTLSEWRRPGSSCRGALVFTLRDLVPGAGWGLVDSLGRPKAPWYAARRVLQPMTAFMTDEGLNGLRLHVVNDTDQGRGVRLLVQAFSAEGHLLDEGKTDVTCFPRDGATVNVERVLGGFRDVTYAYRFGARAIDIVTARWFTPDGSLHRATYLPGGEGRPIEDIGLKATTQPAVDGWAIDISTDRFAHWISIDVPGRRVSDSWFHLPPGDTRVITVDGDEKPEGHVHALNHLGPVPIELGSAQAHG